MNADELMQHYSVLKESEKREFDRRYKSLMNFRKNMDLILKAFTRTNPPRKGNKHGKAKTK